MFRKGFAKGQGGKRQGGERRQIFIKPGWPEEASEEVIPMAEKKKEEKKAAAQEIPDELPSLAEDILTSGPAAESKGAAPAEGDVPDELPTLDEELPPEAEQAAKPAQPARASRASGQQPREVGLSDEEALALDDESYFGHLVGHMKKNPNIPDDFLDEMKTFWKGHGGEREAEMREDLKTSFELDLEKEMQEKVKQLKELEALWKSQKMEFERTKKLVENTEIEISLRSEELKKILCVKTKHVVGNDGVIQHENRFFQLEGLPTRRIRSVVVEEHLDGRFLVRNNGTCFRWRELSARPVRQPQPPATRPTRQPLKAHAPVEEHPWRRYRATKLRAYRKNPILV